MHSLESDSSETSNLRGETAHNGFDAQNELSSDVMMSMPLWDRMIDILGDGTYSDLVQPSVDLDLSMFTSFSESFPHRSLNCPRIQELN